MDWDSIFANNTFDKAVITKTPENTVRSYDYLGGPTFYFIRGIYSAIQKYPINQVAQSGDTINVAAGTYTTTEQVLINKNLSIVGDAINKPTISPTADFTANNNVTSAWFLVNADVTFNLSNVVLDGNGKNVQQAVRSHGTTSIANVDFANIVSNTSPDVGFAIANFGGTVPGGAGSDTHGSSGTASTLTLTNSTFTNIGRVGVLTKGTSSTATLTGNIYTGKGEGTFLDYAFEFGAGGSGTVSGNTISGNLGVAGDGSTSAGILVTEYYGSGTNAIITGNTFSNNTAGLHVGYLDNDASTVVAHNNNFSGETVGVESDAATITVNATNNWWGSAVEADIQAKISGSVSYDPWYLNPSMSVLSNAISGDGTVDSTTENFDLVPSTAGHTELPAGVTDITLGNDTKLDLNSAVASQSGSFTGGNLAGEDLSVPQMIGDISVTVGESVNLQSGTNGQPIVLTNNSLPNVSLEIPDDTTVLAPVSWDGTIAPPTTGSDSGTAPSGFSVGGDTVIEVGSSTGVLLFDKPVSVILTGVTGAVAYRPSGSTTWVQITTICGGTYDSPNAPEFPGECAIALGGNTKIFTYHLTSFGGLDAIPPTPTPGSGGGGGGGSGTAYAGPVSTPTPTPTATPLPEVLGEAITRGNPANLSANGLKEGDTVFAGGSTDPDVYIVNQFGYKRLFLSPAIFEMYGHLKNGWGRVRSIIAQTRDAFPTSVLFRNCETNDLKVYALETTSEDVAVLHWVNLTGDQAVAQDAEFFKKVFCINSNEFNWYSKSSTDFTALSQVPVYARH